MKNLPDWAVRAVKTFAQAFLGVLIPALVSLLSGGFPESVSTAWVFLSPAIAAAISAGISALWNFILAGGEDGNRDQ